MPVIVKFDNTTQCPIQVQVLNDATPANDGIMTAAQVQLLYSLIGGGGSQRGFAAFSSGGSGEGFDFVTVTFPVAFAGVPVITVSPNIAGTAASPPMAWVDSATSDGNMFVIRVQAQFVGSVSWAAGLPS